jgi:hypothetical protein
MFIRSLQLTIILFAAVPGACDPAPHDLDPVPPYVVAEDFLRLTGPDSQPIELNPGAIIALRPPRARDHFAKGIKCLCTTSDGHFFAVIESCAEVDQLLKQSHP